MTVDLGALVANYRALEGLAGPNRMGAVVKADAYGLGVGPVVEALLEAGCSTFFVAQLEEAADLAAKFPEAPFAVYVLNGLLPGQEADARCIGARPVLNSLEQVAAWREAASTSNSGQNAALHVDTGMNRLGLAPDEARALLQDPASLEGISLTLLMSHLACADRPDMPLSDVQRRAFETVRAAAPTLPASLANSAGIFLGKAFHYDLVRPGIALYGGNPLQSGALPVPLQPVVTLKAPVLQVRDVEPGATVGYGASFVAKRPTRIATIGAGYADGVLRALSNRGEVVVRGQRVPIAGRVSMDLVGIDVTDVPGAPDGPVGPGEPVTLLGDGVTIDDLAEKAGTIGYEILTSLGRRYRRTVKPVAPADTA
ncbi:MAG: alanine racemase [Pseudomonadota bacterium]